MRNWKLPFDSHQRLTLASDARFGTVSYTDDQIWELQGSAGEPAGLSLQTTYGLRARSLRIFPRFLENNLVASAPHDFAVQPVLHHFYTNFASLSFSPFPDLLVNLELWVPQSDLLLGRVYITNQGVTRRELRQEWIVQLSPDESGQRMLVEKLQNTAVLVGKTGNLTPVFFMTGSAEAFQSPYSSLSQDLALLPGQAHECVWGMAGCSEAETSLLTIRRFAGRSWAVIRAAIDLQNAALPKVYTGLPSWDRIFALSQQIAHGLLVGPTEHLPAPSLVITRQPDQGFSLRGDGRDYDHLWNGQSPFDTAVLFDLLLPGSPELARGLLDNFIYTQTESGEIDLKPGLGGQRSGIAATPILAGLAWRLYAYTRDSAWLVSIYDSLVRYLQGWFTSEHDHDGDGIPEWDHLIQLSLTDHPVFAAWQPGYLGLEISRFESPALSSLLYHECLSLLEIAREIGRTDGLAAIRAYADNLASAVLASYDQEMASFRYWDRDTHLSLPGRLVYECRGNGLYEPDDSRIPRQRLYLVLYAAEERSRSQAIQLIGLDAQGQQLIETIPREAWQWNYPQARYTTQAVFSALQQIEVNGLSATERLTVATLESQFEDLSLLLPLWAGIPGSAQASQVCKACLTNPQRYWRPFGLSVFPAASPYKDLHPASELMIGFQTMITRGLLKYGSRQTAAQLFTHLMAALELSLHESGRLRQSYHAVHGAGSGEYNAVQGLAPLGLFLEVLGVEIYSPWRVRLSGQNPFPWTVKIKFRGLVIERAFESTRLTFPNGEIYTQIGSDSSMISMEFETDQSNSSGS